MIGKTLTAAIVASAIAGGCAGWAATKIAADSSANLARPQIAIVDYTMLLDLDVEDMEAAMARLREKIHTLQDAGWLVIDSKAVVGKPPATLLIPVD